jgi:hypothetical protein
MKRGICSPAVRTALVDFLVPVIIGILVLFAVDEIRGESAAWWLVLVIFLVVFAVYEGIRRFRRRSPR